MAGKARYRELRNYRDGDLVACFGTDLWLGGATAVPNLLLRHYRRIGLADGEMMLVIQLMRLRAEEDLLYPEAGRLAECLQLEAAEVEGMVRTLLEREVLGLGRYFDTVSRQVVEGYDFTPLFKKLETVWAGVKTEEGLEARTLMEQEAAAAREEEQRAASVYAVFEREFGRPFSAIEIQQIDKWLAQVSEPLLMEALRQAVLNGKHNLKYIDGIIREWQKNNLRTVAEIETYNQQFRARRKTRAAAEKAKESPEEAEARRKKLMQTIFVS